MERYNNVQTETSKRNEQMQVQMTAIRKRIHTRTSMSSEQKNHDNQI